MKFATKCTKMRKGKIFLPSRKHAHKRDLKVVFDR